MAQDATGTPTSKGIPKYNTAVDAPSGKGFNAAMDAINTLLSQIVPSELEQDGAVTGAALVWTGTGWTPQGVADVDWVPTLEGSVSNPVLGVGALQSGRYAIVSNILTGHGSITTGTSGFTNGSGDIRIVLPATTGSIPANSKIVLGNGWIFDSSAAAITTVIIEASSTTRAIIRATGSTIVQWTAPFTWSTQDQLHFHLNYRTNIW
jgi:hypothetical protein